MGLGTDLGIALRGWLEADPDGLLQSRTIANRLVDQLGAQDSLKGPIRDLASQPLLLQALTSSGASQQSALNNLSQQLSLTYAPAVLAELLDLLEAASGVALVRSRPDAAAEPAAELAPKPVAAASRPSPGPWLRDLQRLGPGLALGASAALVLSWAAWELDRAVFDGWGWSGGVVLVLLLGLLQALAIGPFKPLRRLWPLESPQAESPGQAWRWVSQAWIHHNQAEAVVNLMLLLILLGNAALQLGDVVLRYCLTSLACLGLSAVVAQRFGIRRRWSGASGAIGALIALAAGWSLLQWRELPFHSAGLAIPAWVLLLAYGALQLSWQLPREDPQERSRAWQRLLSSCWTWGTLLGLSWALISWLRELLQAPAA